MQYFNPRVPCGTRRHFFTLISAHREYFNPRVPCGTRPCYTYREPKSGYFNPRVPCGTRHRFQRGPQLPANISIHGSRVGPDGYFFQGSARVLEISIHGSRVGPDFKALLKELFALYFNPRVPCGTRQEEAGKRLMRKTFQSTGPVWDPTGIELPLIYKWDISIHGSRVGPDKCGERICL